jgi:hypothetical protein
MELKQSEGWDLWVLPAGRMKNKWVQEAIEGI